MDSAGIAGIGQQIERLSKQAYAPQIISVNGSGMPVVVEDGKIVARPDLAKIPDVLLRPQKRDEKADILTIDSFIAYVNRHKQAKSVLLSNHLTNAFRAIIDYEDDAGVLNKAHQAALALQKTIAFESWEEHADEQMTPEDFALFLEANAGDVTNPSAAEMMQIATGIRATKDVEFESKVKLENGAYTFRYKEEVKGSYQDGQTEVPTSFRIAVVIYRGQTEAYSLECKLRYRVNAGGLVLWYSIPLLERALEDAFNSVKKQIADGVNSKPGNTGELEMFDAKL